MHLTTIITTAALALATTVNSAVVAAPANVDKPLAVELPANAGLVARQNDWGVDCNGYCSGTKHCCAWQDGLYSRCHSHNTPCSKLSFPDALSADSPYPGHTTPLTTSTTESVTTTSVSSGSEVTVFITGSLSVIGSASSSSSSSTTSTPPVRGGPHGTPSVQAAAKAALTNSDFPSTNSPPPTHGGNSDNGPPSSSSTSSSVRGEPHGPLSIQALQKAAVTDGGAHVLTDTTVEIVAALGTTTVAPSSVEWTPLPPLSDNDLTAAETAGSTITTTPADSGPTSLPLSASGSAPWEGDGFASIVSALESWLAEGMSFSYDPTSTASSAQSTGTQTHTHPTGTSAASEGSTLTTSPSPPLTISSLPINTSRTNTVTPEQQSIVTSTTVEASTTATSTATLDGEPSAEPSDLDGSDGAPLGSTNDGAVIASDRLALGLQAGLIGWVLGMVV